METDSGRSGEGKFSRAVSTRTLTDVIHDDADDDGDGDAKEERRSWKHFKEKIRSHGRRSGSGGGGSAWTSSVAVPASDVPVQTSKKRVMFRHASGRVSAAPESDPGMQGADIGAVQDFRSSSLRRNSSGRSERSARFDSDPSPLRRLQEEAAEEERAAEEKAEAGGGDEGAGAEAGVGAGAGVEEGEEAPVKMSLMSLLAGNDDEYGMEEEDDEEEEEERGGANMNCSICMVRHKGAAFDPCGHSFCRLCSREMWVQGGSCPLCNNYVLEILDIF